MTPLASLAPPERAQGVPEIPLAAPEVERPPAERPEPAYILFAVWFRPKTGARNYRLYLEEASPIAQEYGAHRVEGLVKVEALLGSFNPDYVFITEWPSIDAYHRFQKDVRYRAVAPLLAEAVEKTVVLHTKRA